MKSKIFLLLIMVISMDFAFPQSSIVSLSVSPANPTQYDTVHVYADLMFPNSNCVLQYKNHSVIGNNVMASTMYCLGSLPAICNAIDTFIIDPLPAGTYTFALTLSSGYGGPPCTPGIVPDDHDSVSFMVTGSVGKEEIIDQLVGVFPNPVRDVLIIDEIMGNLQQLVITSMNGSIVIELNEPENEIDVSSLPKGVYLLQIHVEEGTKILKFVKE